MAGAVEPAIVECINEEIPLRGHKQPASLQALVGGQIVPAVDACLLPPSARSDAPIPIIIVVSVRLEDVPAGLQLVRDLRRVLLLGEPFGQGSMLVAGGR